jgi:transcriptional regulator with XRE-family HTH domain
MMKLHEKIRILRKQKGYSLTALEKKLIQIFGDKALRYNSLYRIEKGMRDARVSSLSQLCIALGISLRELREGTESEVAVLGDVVRTRYEKLAHYVYSEKAYAELLTGELQPFLAMRLVLEPGGETKLERDPLELGHYQKWVYGIKGKIICIVGEKQFLISKNESFAFQSTLPHYFRNAAASRSICLVVQNPKHY